MDELINREDQFSVFPKVAVFRLERFDNDNNQQINQKSKTQEEEISESCYFLWETEWENNECLFFK